MSDAGTLVPQLRSAQRMCNAAAEPPVFDLMDAAPDAGDHIQPFWRAMRMAWMWLCPATWMWLCPATLLMALPRRSAGVLRHRQVA